MCGSDFSCEYGLESCCGVDSPSLQCDCFENETIVCFNTDACFLPNCEFNCPEDSVASGSACDSTGFAGWIMFGEDGEPTEGSCLYDEESCSCPGLPGSGASCQCIDDVWACGEIPCENCVGIVNLTSVP
uniref:Uncharacterized protein n=1 Tax=Grammatophora oceanica TaxID=210454 RepID=A0A6U5FTT8_9STRA